MNMNDLTWNEAKPLAQSKEKTAVDFKSWKAAQDFEAMFVKEMYKSMRKAMPQESELVKDSGDARKTFTEMLDGEYSKQVANTHSLGLAQKLYKEMTGKEAPASVTRAQFNNESALKIPNWNKDHLDLPQWKSQDVKEVNAHDKLAKYDSYIQQASQAFNVDSSLIKSVIHQESGGNPKAHSSAGAKGLMQLTAIAAKDVGTKPSYDPKANIMGGVAYLKKMLDRYDGNEKLALAAYNAGPGNVSKYNGIPPFSETKNYVKEVLSRRAGIKEYLSGKEA